MPFGARRNSEEKEQERSRFPGWGRGDYESPPKSIIFCEAGDNMNGHGHFSLVRRRIFRRKRDTRKAGAMGWRPTLAIGAHSPRTTTKGQIGGDYLQLATTLSGP